MPDFYPDINDYLELTENSSSVTAQGLERFAYRIRAHTGLDYDICFKLVKYYFQEIRNAMLRKEMVTFKSLGKFYLDDGNHVARFIVHNKLSKRIKNDTR